MKECSIIADPNSKSWKFCKHVIEHLSNLTDEQSTFTYDLNEVHIQEFRDGEIKPRIKNNVRKKVCVFIADSNKHPQRWFTEVALINYTLKHSSASQVINIFPYMPYARQDRKDEARVAISARVVADIVGMYADRVISLDIHNPAIQGFYSIPFDNLFSFPTFTAALKKSNGVQNNNLVVMSPDAGGFGRARACARQLGIDDLAVGNKVRHKAGEIEELRIVGDVDGKDVLIVDDIIDSGGTLVTAAKAARKQGAQKIYAYATHGLFTKGVDYIINDIDKVFVGNTITHDEHEKLHVISFAELFAQAIHRTNEGHSLSALFSPEFWKIH